jgi:hypothetical protein
MTGINFCWVKPTVLVCSSLPVDKAGNGQISFPIPLALMADVLQELAGIAAIVGPGINKLMG